MIGYLIMMYCKKLIAYNFGRYTKQKSKHTRGTKYANNRLWKTEGFSGRETLFKLKKEMLTWISKYSVHVHCNYNKNKTNKKRSYNDIFCYNTIY